MDTVRLLPGNSAVGDFVAPEYLPEAHDQFTLRDLQFCHSDREFRPLTQTEIQTLTNNGNRADDWACVSVSDPFTVANVRDSVFRGSVRIGVIEDRFLEHHGLRVPVGISNSHIISSDIGDHVAVHNVDYMAHVVTGDQTILFNLHEIHTTGTAKFGNGILKDGEEESSLLTIDLVNETGSRSVCPFESMLPADAYLWSRYREDSALQDRLLEFTQAQASRLRGHYSSIGSQTVIKHCRIIKDVKIGSHCYIKGVNKLKNVTINSSHDEPTEIGEGVELVNGIVGPGSKVFYGSKAVRFVLGARCELAYGARLIHTYLADNSTVSCCEIQNNLIFPGHSQHHNNSFLIASLIMGQSNIAAGVTIGSNHNSRSNDGEIQAGRGFWPGLNVSLKHSSRFASYVMIAKGSYPSELDVRLPFSLVSNNLPDDLLEIRPAFFWLQNMYALVRDDWKYDARDKRHHKRQNIQTNSLAPDTIEEIILAMRLIEVWTAIAASEDSSRAAARADDELAHTGRRILSGPSGDMDGLVVTASDVERSSRETRILRPREAHEAYGQMLLLYSARTLVSWLVAQPGRTYEQLVSELAGPRVESWINLGGQLASREDADDLRARIGRGDISSWEDVHRRYDELWDQYPDDLARHAYSVFALIAEDSEPSGSSWSSFLEQAVSVQNLVRDRVYESRNKDFTNSFRRSMYQTDEEMLATLGSIEDDPIVRRIARQSEEFEKQVLAILGRE